MMTKEEMIKSLPAPDTLFPRDGEPLDHTGDLLFLAALLWNGGHDDVLIEWEEKIGGTLYLFFDGDEKYRRPVDGSPADNPEGCIEKGRIETAALQYMLKEKYFHYRRRIETLSSDIKTGYKNTIKIDGTTVYKIEKEEKGKDLSGIQSEAFDTINNTLTWKLGETKDIEKLLQERGMPAPAAAGAHEPHQAFCPLDGPVQTIDLEIISPQWDWDGAGGRRWKGPACPKCLGVFYMKMVEGE